MVGILDIRHRNRGIGHPVVDHCIHGDRHRITCEYLHRMATWSNEKGRIQGFHYDAKRELGT